VADRLKVALVFRGDRDARDNMALEETRLAKIGDALGQVGISPVPAVFSESFADEVYRQLLGMDGVLVWIDPFSPAGDRSVLDDLLRQVAGQGVYVSAHPDIIEKMGTKEVLYATREMDWGCDTRLYRSLDEFRSALPEALTGGPRVLKQYRGNGGNGVFKVQLVDAQANRITGETRLLVRHARRGSAEEVLTFDDLVERCAAFFTGVGRIIDQPYQQRLADGMIRCYLVADKIAGFGEQLVNALFPTPEGASEPVQPGPRLYYPPGREDLQPLKAQLENAWLAEMQRRLGVGDADLPVIWDADFLYGPKTATGEDTFVLCEINVSAVFPFPDEALVPLAAETARRLAGRI